MSASEAVAAPRKPGRPRSREADTAILDATIVLLAEVGFQALSIERVAAVAHVGKKTIYRRWSSKEALVCDAIRTLQSEMPFLDTGNLRDDLAAMNRNALAVLETVPVMRPLYLRLASEIYANSAVFETFLEELVMPRVEDVKRLIRKAQDRGEVRSDIDLDLIIDLLIGPVLSRWLFVGLLAPAMSEASAAPFVHQLVELQLGVIGGR